MQMWKKFFIVLTLGLLMASAFSIRLASFKRKGLNSIDEMVYYRMAQQTYHNPADYNTIPYAHELMAQGRDLPDYFTRPLFKYPPLFTYLISLSFFLFGISRESAVFVSIFAGVLLIPLTYLMGRLAFNPKVGFLAAVLVAIDPVAIIC